MRITQDTISILLSTDEHYMIMLAVLLKSIEVNHKTPEKIHVVVICDKVKASSQRKVEASLDPDTIKIQWINMKDVLPSAIKLPIDHTSFSLIVYLRLFIGSLFPVGTEKALYMDTDMLVLDDISKLYHIDIGDDTIGAVQDPRLLTFDNPWGGVLNYKELGFKPETKYFNTGLLLIDIPKWIEQKILQRVLDAIKKHIKFANYPDQYGLNIILAEEWTELHPRWNAFASDNLNDPGIVHFIGRKPIYRTYNYNQHYLELFEHYKKLTAWRDVKPINEFHRYLKKINNIGVKFREKLSNTVR